MRPRKWPAEKMEVEIAYARTETACLESPPQDIAIQWQVWPPSAVFAEGHERARKPATCWLCWQAAANCSPFVEFADHWENRGKFVPVALFVHA